MVEWDESIQDGWVGHIWLCVDSQHMKLLSLEYNKPKKKMLPNDFFWHTLQCRVRFVETGKSPILKALRPVGERTIGVMTHVVHLRRYSAYDSHLSGYWRGFCIDIVTNKHCHGTRRRGPAVFRITPIHTWLNHPVSEQNQIGRVPVEKS